MYMREGVQMCFPPFFMYFYGGDGWILHMDYCNPTLL